MQTCYKCMSCTSFFSSELWNKNRLISEMHTAQMREMSFKAVITGETNTPTVNMCLQIKDG